MQVRGQSHRRPCHRHRDLVAMKPPLGPDEACRSQIFSPFCLVTISLLFSPHLSCCCPSHCLQPVGTVCLMNFALLSLVSNSICFVFSLNSVLLHLSNPRHINKVTRIIKGVPCSEFGGTNSETNKQRQKATPAV